MLALVLATSVIWKILDLSISLIQKKHFIGQYRRKNIFVLIHIGGGFKFSVLSLSQKAFRCIISATAAPIRVLHVYLRFVSSSFCYEPTTREWGGAGLTDASERADWSAEVVIRDSGCRLR